jgi:hypothetical protein
VYRNPAFVQVLATDRVAELRHVAETGASHRHDVRRPRVIESARHGAGWLLVDLGLRLALPRRAMKPVARAHR